VTSSEAAHIRDRAREPGAPPSKRQASACLVAGKSTGRHAPSRRLSAHFSLIHVSEAVAIEVSSGSGRIAAVFKKRLQGTVCGNGSAHVEVRLLDLRVVAHTERPIDRQWANPGAIVRALELIAG